MSSVVVPTGTRKVFDSYRRTVQHRVTRRLGGALLAVGGSVVLLGPLRSVLVLSMGVATSVLLALWLLGLTAALLMRRTSQELRRSPSNPARIGHRLETTHDGVRVRHVERARSGLTMSLSWQARHHIELDLTGIPLSIESEGPGRASWVLPYPLVGRDVEFDALRDLVGSDLSLVEHALVEVTGLRITRRVLASRQGIVLDLHA